MDQAGTISNGSRIFASHTGTKRPILSSSAKGMILTFDGANDRLDLHESDLSTDVAFTLDTSAGGWTLFAIYTSADWADGDMAIFGDVGSNDNFMRHRPGTTNKFEVKINGTIKRFDLNNPTTLVNNRYHAIMLTATEDSTSILKLHIDGVTQADSETIANTNDFVVEQLASKNTASDPLNGAIKHIVVYDKLVTTGERKELNAWAEQHIG